MKGRGLTFREKIERGIRGLYESKTGEKVCDV